MDDKIEKIDKMEEKITDHETEIQTLRAGRDMENIEIKELKERNEELLRAMEQKDRELAEIKNELAEMKKTLGKVEQQVMQDGVQAGKVPIIEAEVSALRAEIKEDKDERKEIIDNLQDKQSAIGKTVDRMPELENEPKDIANSAGPNHKETNQTFTEETRKTHELRDEMKETVEDMMAENKQTANNNTWRAKTLRHTKTQLVVFGMEEKDIADRTERKDIETKEIHKILKSTDKDWDNAGLVDHYRIGRYMKNNTKPRPTKITFDSNERMFNFLTKARILKDIDEFKHIRIHKHLNREEREILKEELTIAQRENNARSDEEEKEFFWAIRGIRARKIYIHQSTTPRRG